MAPMLPSPALALVGRHNSGKTSLIEKLIERCCLEGLDVGSVKHHGHAGFDIDVPGKDSYRHRAAGASETYIVAPGQMACVKTIPGDMECAAIVANMPGHDIVLVEGYRLSGLPTIEMMRAANERDLAVAQAFEAASREGLPLTADFVQAARSSAGEAASTSHLGGKTAICSSGESAPHPNGESAPCLDGKSEPYLDDSRYETPSPGTLRSLNSVHGSLSCDSDTREKMPLGTTVAIVSDIPLAHEAAQRYGIPAFDINDIEGIFQFIKRTYVRPRLSLAIQAGGESKRMGQSKALVTFDGEPLIQHMVRRMLPVADELIITTNEAERLEFLFEAFPKAPLRLVEDELEQRGALPGLYTALNAARNPMVALIACDMAFASPKLVAHEYAKLSDSNAAVCIPVNTHGFEPFHAIYRTNPCLQTIKECLESGCQRIQDVLARVDTLELSQKEVRSIEPAGRCFFNVNTPEDLEKARSLLEL